jgi:hypothetical protein
MAGGRFHARATAARTALGSAACAGACAALAMCSPFGADTGGGPPGADAGTPPGAEPPGPAEAGPDAAGSNPCAGHRFCERFDDPTFKQWPARDDGAGPLVLDDQVAASPPSSLRVDVGPGAGTRSSYLAVPLPVSGHVAVSAALETGHTGPAAGEIDVISVGLVPAPGNLPDYRVILVAMPDGSIVLEDRTPDYRATPISASTAAFDTYTLDVDFSSGKLAVRKNGTLQTPPLDIAAVPPSALAGRHVELKVGASFANNEEGTFHIFVDDVTVD